MLEYILDFLYPPICLQCNNLIPSDWVLCAACCQNWQRIASTPYGNLTVHAAGLYEGVVRELVQGKFTGNRTASVQLAKLILQQTLVRTLEVDCIVPIPLHWTRKARRGFNQAQVMAKVLGRALNLPVHQALRRSKRTVFQSSLSKAERVHNVQSALVPTAAAAMLTGKRVLLIDDLLTTGATMRSAAHAVQASKPAAIIGIVGAKV